jgi:ribosomal protein L24E
MSVCAYCGGEYWSLIVEEKRTLKKSFKTDRNQTGDVRFGENPVSFLDGSLVIEKESEEVLHCARCMYKASECCERKHVVKKNPPRIEWLPESNPDFIPPPSEV